MNIVIPGGSGQIGQILSRELRTRGHRVQVLSRTADSPRLRWDGRSLGPWTRTIDGADVVINLAGRSVNCRYNKSNLEQMYSSRIDSTLAVGRAIARAERPPRLWLQMSTATIYAHRFDADNDEHAGIIGGNEPDVPNYWRFSVEIAKAWERALFDVKTRATRKVAMRTAMVMSPDDGGVFSVLHRLVRLGLGGAVAGGDQYISWIHADDFVAAILHLIERADLSGSINLASPHPLPQRQFMATLRKACSVRLGLPASKQMLSFGALIMRTDPELLLKSRRVVPTRLLESGFRFAHADWQDAASSLVARRSAISLAGPVAASNPGCSPAVASARGAIATSSTSA